MSRGLRADHVKSSEALGLHSGGREKLTWSAGEVLGYVRGGWREEKRRA